MLTEQQVFDRVAKHLLTQNKKSGHWVCGTGFGRIFDCLYRGPNGLKCAIGVLIPDEKYEPEFEGLGAINKELCAAAGISHIGKDFLGDLQDIHDQHRPSRWAQKLRAFAKKHKLNPAAAS